MAGDPVFILDVIGIAAEVAFFRFGAGEVETVYHQEHEAAAQGISHTFRHHERHERQPVGDVLRNVGGMFRPAIRAVCDNAPMREVGKAAAEDNRGVKIDAVKADDAGTPHAINGMVILQPRAPGKIAGVIQIRFSQQRPKRLIACKGHNPSGSGRLGGTQVRVEQSEGNEIADARDGNIGQENVGIAEFKETGEVVNGGKIEHHEIVEVGREVGEHQCEEVNLHEPAEGMLDQQFGLQLVEAELHEKSGLIIAVVRIGLP